MQAVTDSVEQRKSTARVANADNMVLPPTIPKLAVKADEAKESKNSGAPVTLMGGAGITFKLLKKGVKGKIEARQVSIAFV